MAIGVVSMSGVQGPESSEAMLVRNWTTRVGLPHDPVRAATRTRDGFLWLGTDSGLSCFDGREFRNFGMREGLESVSEFSDSEVRIRCVAWLCVAAPGRPRSAAGPPAAGRAVGR